MKTNILRFAFFAIVLSSLPTIDLDAQTIIDTNYYRYAYSPFKHEYWSPVWAYDEVTGEGYIVDSVSMCVKDQYGYFDIHSVEIHTYRYYYGYGSTITAYPELSLYHYIPLPHDNMDIYGIAIFLDSIKEFQPGDYLTMYVCKKSDDGTHMINIDSVVLNEHTVGMKRFMSCPINSSSIYTIQYDTNNYPIPHDYCIGHNELSQVMEVYFEHPVHIADSQLFLHIKLFDNSARFYFSFRGAAWPISVYNYDCSWWGPGLSYDYMMAIIEPLPQWEQDRMELLITDVEEDPQDPEDPDPDNPGGDEGIDNFEIQNSNFEINIYPNPTTGILHIQLNNNALTQSRNQTITSLNLRDINGRLIRTLRNCGTSTALDTSTLTPGLYTLQVTTPTGTTTRKLAIK